jgi:sulfotransferase
MKSIVFLSGMHRSGNTLLSALLNQHPEIYSSSPGPVCDYMWNLHNTFQNYEMSLINTKKDRSIKLISNLIENYYSDVDKPIIVERNKFWPLEENLNLIQTYITKSPKIIFTVRPMLEVVSSFIALDSANILKQMNEEQWVYNHEISENDNMCHFLMRSNGRLASSIHCLDQIKKKEYSDFFHVVEYSQLTTDTQNVLNGVYDFISVKPFLNNIKNIVDLEPTSPESIGLPKNLHKVDKEIKESQTDPYRLLSQSCIDQYVGLKFLNSKI